MIESFSNWDLEKVALVQYSLIEHKISLEDSLIQILTQPEEFSLLNIDRASRTQLVRPRDSDDIVTYVFDLS